MKLLFVSKKRFEVGSRVRSTDGSLFRDQKAAIKHHIWSDGGGHVYEVDAEDECSGIVTRWLSSVSGVNMSMDSDVVFNGVPDKKEILGRMGQESQGRAFEHDPEGRKGKKWLHSKKKSARVAKKLDAILDSEEDET